MDKNQLEIFDGIDDSILIVDSYPLKISNIKKSLKFQKKLSSNQKRIFISVDESIDDKILNEIKKFNVDIIQISENDEINFDIKSNIILLRGKSLNIEKKLRNKLNNTFIEINLNAIKKNNDT